MVCIYCGHQTDVYNSRPKAKNPAVWRRRRCQVCVAQFTTTELPDYSTAILVRASDRIHLEPFSRDMLLVSILKSVDYRNDALQCATELTATIIGRLLGTKKAMDGVLSTKDIAEVAQQTLKRFDPPAGSAYKAFHQKALRPSL